MFHMKAVKEESAAGTQRFLDELERHRCQVASLSRPFIKWDDWLVTVASLNMPTTYLQHCCLMLQSINTGRSSTATDLPRA